MKKIIRTFCISFLLLTVACSVAWSMDFVDMTNRELFALQGAIQNAPDGDKKAYQGEWEKRIASMTEEEKKQFAVVLKNKEDNKDEYKLPFLLMGQGYDDQQGEERVIDERIPQLKHFDSQ